MEVVLRFHPRVAMRVQESRWHRGQQIEVQPDGYLIWRAKVAEPQEMLPWVRGWGADVEVLEPVELRDEVIAEVRTSLGTYANGRQHRSAIRTFSAYCAVGAKRARPTAEFHPAVFHMLDVANVAAGLLSAEAPPRFRRVLALALNAEEQHLVDWLPWLVALHDIGKITASFQGQNATQKSRLRQEGFSFSGWSASDNKPHSIFSQMFVEDLLTDLIPAVKVVADEQWQR